MMLYTVQQAIQAGQYLDAKKREATERRARVVAKLKRFCSVGLNLFMVCLCVGMAVFYGWRIYSTGFDDGRELMQAEAVKHGAAQYNPQTAKFEWITRGPTE